MTSSQIRFVSLVRREVNRFLKIKRQTVGAPLLEPCATIWPSLMNAIRSQSCSASSR